MTTHTVFVYGTIKQGYGLHRLLGVDAEKVGIGRLRDHAIFNLGSFPGVAPADNGSFVIGEVYRVSDEAMESLDYVEGEGSLYLRKRVTIEIGSVARVDAWVYIYNGTLNPERIIESGEWTGRQA